MQNDIFPWSEEYKSNDTCTKIIKNIIRIDIAFSRKEKGIESWYHSKTFDSQSVTKDEFKTAQRQYSDIIDAFKKEVNKVPIDYLKKDCRIHFFNFKKVGNDLLEEVK